MTKQIKEKENLMRWVSYGSMAVALTLIVVKLVAYFMTHSLSLLSSLTDSVLDIGASLVNFIAIRQSLIPADREHRFGHGKAEAVGGLIQGAIITASGIFLLMEMAEHLVNPRPLERLDIGLWVMGFSIVLTFILISFQKYVVRHTQSISVHADHVHYTGDIMMNVGVIISMVLAYVWGLAWVDTLFATLVAIYLFYSAFHVVREALFVLMDGELPKNTREQIRKIVLKHPKVQGMHDLRTRGSGLYSFIQFHTELNKNMPLEEATQVCRELQSDIKKTFPGSETLIHTEPK